QLVLWILWRLWKSRNLLVHQQKQVHWKKDLDTAKSDATDCIDADAYITALPNNDVTLSTRRTGHY
ncbi:unnamed protein product, partial [Arabidopsis halleri]